MTGALARLDAVLASGVLDAADEAGALSRLPGFRVERREGRFVMLARGDEAARLTLDGPAPGGGAPLSLQVFLSVSPIAEDDAAARERHEDEALAMLGELADALASRPGFVELDALREARFEDHVVEALDVALFRSDALDVAIVADAPATDVPVFVIAELVARRRPRAREEIDAPVGAEAAIARLREIASLPLLGAGLAECTEATAAKGWTLLRAWDDAIALFRDHETARLAFHDGACDLVAVTLGALPASDPAAIALHGAVAAELPGDRVEAPAPIEAIAWAVAREGDREARLAADAANGTLRLELETVAGG